MKRTLTAMLMVFAIMVITVSCDNHIHTYSDDWSGDDTYHWHTATCEHTTEAKDMAKHTFDKGGNNNSRN